MRTVGWVACDTAERLGSVPKRGRLLLPGIGMVVVLLLAFTACGGGGDDDDDTSPTSVGGTSVSATTVASAGTPTSATGVDATSTSTTVPATATMESTATATVPPATPTRVPATVAATPRLIATRVPSVVQAPPTPTPESGTQWIIDESFDDGTTANFPLGTDDNTGSVAQIDQGWYGLTVPDQAWQVAFAEQAGRHNNGVLGADISLVGTGDAGLVARLRIDDDGAYSFLICSIFSTGAAGCWVNNSGEWTEIGYVPDGTIPPADTYRVIMVMEVANVLFTVNDIDVGLFEVDMPEEGLVGLYAGAQDGEMTAWYDWFLFGIGTTAE